MATPIKITPTLTGKAAESFYRRITRSSKKRLSAAEKKRISSLVSRVLKKQA
jgi:hypothetical protein